MNARPLLKCLAAFAFGSVALSGCGGRTDAATDVPRDSASSLNRRDSEPPAVVVDSAMLGAIKIDVIREHAVPRTLVVAGKVQFDEDRLARVLAPLPGQVVDLRARVGDGVRTGQALCAKNAAFIAMGVRRWLRGPVRPGPTMKLFSMPIAIDCVSPNPAVAEWQPAQELAHA